MVDDELIGSRAQDVETETLSYRNADKKGPVVDCLADSMLSVYLWMCSLSRTRGESDQYDLERLLERTFQETLTPPNEIRRQARTLNVQDHVHKLATESLQAMELQDRLGVATRKNAPGTAASESVSIHDQRQQRVLEDARAKKLKKEDRSQ